MSLVIRNADADKLVRLGDVLDALYTFRHEIAQSLSDSTLLDSSPSEVVANVQSLVLEEVDYFAQNLLSEVVV